MFCLYSFKVLITLLMKTFHLNHAYTQKEKNEKKNEKENNCKQSKKEKKQRQMDEMGKFETSALICICFRLGDTQVFVFNRNHLLFFKDTKLYLKLVLQFGFGFPLLYRLLQIKKSLSQIGDENAGITTSQCFLHCIINKLVLYL